jgi:hypothetical protein
VRSDGAQARSTPDRQTFTVRKTRFVSDWVVVAFIVLVIALDDLLHELFWSFSTTRAFILDRLRWIVFEKLRAFWRGAHR